MNANTKSMHDPRSSRREFLEDLLRRRVGHGVGPQSFRARRRQRCHPCGPGGVRRAWRGRGVQRPDVPTPTCEWWRWPTRFASRLDRAYQSLLELDKARVDVPEERKFVGLDAYQQAIDCDVDMVLLVHAARSSARRSSRRPSRPGKHVFMEKPVAVDAPGVRQVLAANEDGQEERTGRGRRPSSAARNEAHRSHPADPRRRDRRRDLHAGLLQHRPHLGPSAQPDQTEMQYQVNNWYHFNWLCGDHIVEQHVHDLDVCNWMVKDHPDRGPRLGGRQVRDGPGLRRNLRPSRRRVHLCQRRQDVQLLPADPQLLGQLLRACARHEGPGRISKGTAPACWR